MTRYIDLSHAIEDGMITYRGLPGPVISDHLSREVSAEHYADGTTFQIGKIEMVANTGTYVDSPFHRFEDGKDLSQLPLTSLANLDGCVVRVTSRQARAIDASTFSGIDLTGKAVLVHTAWSRHWNSEQYFQDHPFLTEDAAVFLRDAGASLVGIDSLNIDDTSDGTRPVHTTLLKAGIPIAEHLTRLHLLPDRGFRFFAVPVKVKAFGTFPVRAFGLVDD